MVSPPPSPKIEPDHIRRVASGLEVPLRQEDVDRLIDFAQLFLSWNERINLGGQISATELVDRHFVDSFAAARLIREGARVVDVGSGGGLPALPLATIRPDLTLDLFEPTGKKVAFIRTAIRELGLKNTVSIHAERVASDPERTGRYDVAMSRATWSPQDWLEVGRTLVSVGGSVLVFATAVPKASGDPPRQTLPYATNRCLLVYG